MGTINKLANLLSEIRSGDRLWFWFCAQSPETPLLIERFSDKDAMEKLQSQIEQISLPLGTRSSMGIVTVSAHGDIVFGGPSLSEDGLKHLAEWVRSKVDEHPALGALTGTRFLRIDPLGTIQDKFEDPNLWKDITRPMVPGSLQASATLLNSLKPNEEAWLWMAQGEQSPAVVVVSHQDDPEAKHFSAQVLSNRSRAAGSGAGVRGTIRRLSSGALLMVTPDSLDLVQDQLTSWLSEQGEVRLVQFSGSEPVTAKRIGGMAVDEGFSGQVAALKAINEGATYMFWFSSESKSGGPLLLLEESREALKSLAMEAATSAPFVRGQVRKAKWGLEFRTRGSYPTFLKELSLWVSENKESWPGLLELVGSRMTRRNKDGEVQERFKDDKAWRTLTKKQR